ncbi:MAG: PrgI family protein [Eubacterium sp.]|nr:PrgI family protein [Eubacterium sp.]
MDNGNWNGEVKINKDILKYNEQVVMGLSLKQTVSGAAAMIAAALVFFLTHKSLGNDISVILCAVAAAPIAAIGFVTFNGMTFVELCVAVFQHYMLPNRLFFHSKSFYKELIKLNAYITSKEEKKKNAKNISTSAKDGKELLQNAEKRPGNNSD